jgi:hypothetical protein
MEALEKIARKYDVFFSYIWGTEDESGWIWYKQYNKKNFEVQIHVNDNFDLYKNIKSNIVDLFKVHNCSLSNEENLNTDFGYKKNLYFINTAELKIRIEEKERIRKMNQFNMYNIGEIKADGGEEKKEFSEKLSNHLSNHKWLYAAVIGLIINMLIKFFKLI